MSEPMPHSEAPEVEEPPLWRLLATALSPFALSLPRPIHGRMPPEERQLARLENQRFLQRYMGVYITRSANLMLFGFIGLQLSLFLMPSVTLTLVLGGLVLLASVHLLVVILWKQHLDARLGSYRPPD